MDAQGDQCDASVNTNQNDKIALKFAQEVIQKSNCIFNLFSGKFLLQFFWKRTLMDT